jgi:hypothetical protein
MTSKTFAVWIVMDELGDCDVATNESDALDRWKNSDSGERFTGAVTCRTVKLNVTMSEPTGENGSGAAVDVVVPDDAGRTEEVETG